MQSISARVCSSAAAILGSYRNWLPEGELQVQIAAMSWTQASPGVLNPRGNLCDDTFRERHQETTCIHLVTSRPPFDPAGVGLRLPPPASLSRFLIQNEELRLSSLFILCRVCRPEDRWQASCTVILRLGTRMPPQMKHDYHN